MFAAVSLYLFPLFAHRPLDSLRQYGRWAVLTSVLNPGETAVMLAVLYEDRFVLGGIFL